MTAVTTPLRGKKPAFIEQYFICDFNGTEAARRAGYWGNDCTLAAIASENLRKPNIHAAIKERMQQITMQADEVLFRISQQAAGSMGDFVTIDEGGHIEVNLQQAAQLGKLGLIQELTEITTTDKEGSTTHKFKVKLYSSKDRQYKLSDVQFFVSRWPNR